MATVAISGTEFLLRAPVYSATAKAMPGARWVQAAGAWLLPATAQNAERLLADFQIDQGGAYLRSLVARMTVGTSERSSLVMGAEPGGEAPMPKPSPVAPPAAGPNQTMVRGVSALQPVVAPIQTLDLQPVARTPISPLLPVPAGFKLNPWSHQLEGFTFGMDALARYNAVLLAAQMGVGKTMVATMLALARNARRILVVCPLRVVPNWAREIEEYMDGPKIIVALDRRDSRRRSAQAEEAAALAMATGRRLWVVVNYDSFWRDEMVSFIMKQRWDMVIYDECLPAGTLISTPSGQVAIEILNVGDTVLGFDEESGCVVETRIAHTFCNQHRYPLVDLGFVRATENHPIWTTNGYVMAGDISRNDEVLEILPDGNTTVRVVRDVIFERTSTRSAILRHVVFGEVAPQGAGASEAYRGGKAGNARVHANQPGTPGLQTEPGGVLTIEQEPVSRSFSGSQGRSHGSPADELCASERWQWNRPNETTEAVGRRIGVADGGHRKDGEWLQEPRAGELLQDRRSRPHVKVGCRSGRNVSPYCNCPEVGSQEGIISSEPGVDGSAINQSADLGGPAPCDRAHQTSTVFNFETGTGNYFANGILVHNCHRIKSPGGKASMFAKRIRPRTKDVVLATGTPLAHSPLDIYAQFRAAAPSIFGTSYAAFKQRYAKMGGPDKKWVVGYQNTEDLERRMAPITWRCTKREALPDLPEEMDVEYSTDFDDEGARVYAEMERDLITEIEGGKLTAQNALTKVLRLQQICGGAVPTDDGLYHVVDRSKYKLLVDVLEDLGPQPLIMFAQFRSDIAFCHEACAAVGLTSLEVSGQRDELFAWQQGKADVLVAQNQSGSVGINGTRAHTSIYYSLATSLVLYDQARSRIHRATQKENCLHIYLTIRRAMDQKILKGLRSRQDVMESIMSSVADRAFEPYRKEK